MQKIEYMQILLQVSQGRLYASGKQQKESGGEKTALFSPAIERQIMHFLSIREPFQWQWIPLLRCHTGSGPVDGKA